MISQAALNPRQSPTPKHNSNDVQRHGNNTQWTGLVFLVLVLAVIIAGCWMVLHWMRDPQRLPISQLVVTGERHFTRDDDIRQAILSLGVPGTFMTQDVNSIQRQIELLPWIKQASVRKQWPNELKIHLVEYVPVAYWGRHNLIDNKGDIFSLPGDDRQQDGNRQLLAQLPQLSGPPESQLTVLQQSRQIAKVLKKDNLTLQAASMSARHAWQLTLANGIVLHTGRDDTMRRLQRFLLLYPVLQQQAQKTDMQIDYVDLRYESGAAVGWKPAQAMQQAQEKP